MKRRPLTVTIIGWLFVAAGVIGFIYHVADFDADHPLEGDYIWILSLRLLAVAGGVFLLRGSDWARWLLLGWLAYHVVLSAFHSVFEVAAHLLLLIVMAYVLLRPTVSAYFRGTRAEVADYGLKDGR